MITYDASISEAKNHCRNPDGDIDGPWCYVDDHSNNGETWETCGVEWCDNSYNVRKDFRYDKWNNIPQDPYGNFKRVFHLA